MIVTESAFQTGVVTHAGRVRQKNEDHFLVQPGTGLWAVADGMGGHEDGALASATLVATLETIGVPVSAPDLLARLEDRVLRANTQLQDLSRERGGSIIGSTLVVLLVYERHFACVWSGDSRIYLIRDGRMSQLSRDHTEAQGMIDKGLLTPAEALNWPRRHVITRAIGVHDIPELEADQGQLEAGDIFVLCSDGLTTHVRDDEILLHAAQPAPQTACEELLALTLERGATDNVTIVIMRYHPRPAE